MKSLMMHTCLVLTMFTFGIHASLDNMSQCHSDLGQHQFLSLNFALFVSKLSDMFVVLSLSTKDVHRCVEHEFNICNEWISRVWVPLNVVYM